MRLRCSQELGIAPIVFNRQPRLHRHIATTAAIVTTYGFRHFTHRHVVWNTLRPRRFHSFRQLHALHTQTGKVQPMPAVRDEHLWRPMLVVKNFATLRDHRNPQ